ncbi:MAG: chorismate-binding protein [Chloroflexi bacterium]|nr:chorismate-binding protein [Chloroflexota bacterium]
MDTCIGIRTIILKDGVAHVQAGGGIVADSTPQSEYQESLHKMSALLRAIGPRRGRHRHVLSRRSRGRLGWHLA